MNTNQTENGVLDIIGNTPLIKIQNFYDNIDFHVYAKMELLNPGGSMKDRVAINMIQHAISEGRIDSETTVIESSSGNMAIGLALTCAYYGLKFICVADKNISVQNLKIIKAYGSEVIMVDEEEAQRDGMLQARLNKVKELLGVINNSYWPCQYENEYNPKTHCNYTIKEIYDTLPVIDYFFIAVSTCGMLKGCLDYISLNKKNTKVYAVDAEGSVIFGGKKGVRLLPGHGASLEPHFSKTGLMNKMEGCIRVNDYECVEGCRKMVNREAILAGASSGGVLMAIEKIKDNIPPGSNCVAIIADRGERYLDTVFSDHWVNDNLQSYI